MPRKPTPVCRVCQRKNCSDPTHKRKAFATSTPTRQRRPGYSAGRKRRARVVGDYRAQFGSACPKCGRQDVMLTADHLHPVALGGSEDGPLAVLCIHCRRSQGARIANQRRRPKK